MVWSSRWVRAGVAVLSTVLVSGLATTGCVKKKEFDPGIVATATTGPPDTSTATTSPGTTEAPPTTGRTGTTAPRHPTTSRRANTIDASQIGGIDPALFSDLPVGTPYRGFSQVTDSRGDISVELPTTWQTDTDLRTLEGVDLPSIYAAENLSDYQANRSTPGMRFGLYQGTLKAKGEAWAFRHLAELDHLDSCNGIPARMPFQDGVFEGTAIVTTGCGVDGQLTNVHIVATDRSGGRDMVVMQVQLVTQADLDALSHAVRSFKVPN